MDSIPSLDVIRRQRVGILQNTPRVDKTRFGRNLIGVLLVEVLLQILHSLTRRDRGRVFLVASGLDVDGELLFFAGSSSRSGGSVARGGHGEGGLERGGMRREVVRRRGSEALPGHRRL